VNTKLTPDPSGGTRGSGRPNESRTITLLRKADTPQGRPFSIEVNQSGNYHIGVMRIPLTKYGLPQVVVYPLCLALLMVVVGWAGAGRLELWALLGLEGLLGAALVWSLSFFRDPERPCPATDDILLAPADGRVTDIERIDQQQQLGGPAVRIGIFLSIFDVHINRAPCDAWVEQVIYRRGRFCNAKNPTSGRVNESNDIILVRRQEPTDKLLLRQISGAIARRIVCAAAVGDELRMGQRLGMIKFGSRTELYVPAREDVRCLVRVGDKVKAGLTPVVRYERCER